MTTDHDQQQQRTTRLMPVRDTRTQVSGVRAQFYDV
jgi:hypothetical protein